MLLSLAALGGCASTIHTRSEVTIRRPRAEVFGFVADLENLPTWNYYVVSVRRTTPGSVGVGSTFHQVRESDEQDLEIVAYEEGRSIAFATLPPERPLRIRFSLVDGPTGTVLVEEWALDIGAAAVVGGLVTPHIEGAVNANLAHLRELLEEGSTTLQNGRVIRL
jgi:uncharacterized membrane protein